MNRLIKSLENLFAATAMNGGALSRTANFTLEIVNWRDALNEPEPTGHHIVDSYLKAACDNSGPDGSNSREVAQTLMAEADPAGDVDGHDAAAKVVILANLMMGQSMTMQDVSCVGISGVTRDQIQSAQAENQRWKLIGTLESVN